MLLGSLAFSVMATLAHALAGQCDWELVATVRAGLALLFSAGLALEAGAKLVFLRPRVLWMRSLAGTMSLVCTFYALPRLPISDVLTLTNMFPLWVALLSWPVLGARPTVSTWVAIVVGIAGVVLVTQPHVAEARLLPAGVAVAASLSTSVAMLGLHRLGGVDPRAIVAHFSGVSLAVCLAILALDPAESLAESHFEPASLALLGGVGVCATIGQLFLTKAFSTGTPARVSVVALSQVVFAMIFDAVIWRYEFGALSLFGIALVMAPTAWLLLAPRRSRGVDLSLGPPPS
jgi:drug/metabolite transporter (DMT)-like permease